jgi:hypothetical protein
LCAEALPRIVNYFFHRSGSVEAGNELSQDLVVRVLNAYQRGAFALEHGYASFLGYLFTSPPGLGAVRTVEQWLHNDRLIGGNAPVKRKPIQEGELRGA